MGFVNSTTGCSTGQRTGVKYHNFRIPRGATAETRQTWIQNIPNRADRKWDFKTCYVCSSHFEEKFIVKTTKVMMNGKVIKEVPRQRWTLTTDAVPTLFANNRLSHFYDKNRKLRRPPKDRAPPQIQKSHSTESKQIPIVSLTENEVHIQPAEDPVDRRQFTDIRIPNNWIMENEDGNVKCTKLIASRGFPLPTYHGEKQVTFNQLGYPQVSIRGHIIEHIGDYKLDSLQSLNSVVDVIDKIRICEGIKNYGMFQDFPTAYRCGPAWISNSCKQLVGENEQICKMCLELKPRLCKAANHLLSRKRQQRVHPPNSKLSILRKKCQISKKTVRRLTARNVALKLEKKSICQKLRNAESSSLVNAIEKSDLLTPQLKLALKTSVSLQKAKSKTGHRYTADWILQALLLKITSPKAYNHLRSEGILPLPNAKYLTQILSGMKCEFGFNDFILNHLKKEFSSKPKQDRQVFLCFDEIKVKEAISFDRAKMRFTGFVDYGEFTSDLTGKSKKPNQEADHALVFMVRCINSKMTQPIGVFASHAAAPGNILSKMIISAIVKLEGAGLEVIGVVSDGATSNKSAWKHLGISGTENTLKNKIPNPADPTRNVHFLCDIPHIVKCIRNNFHNKKQCLFSGKMINWGFYEAVFDLDRKNQLRVVPRLTYHHINPGPFQKMSVSRAVQVFSKSMADGISFYREHIRSPFMKNSETTENFTRVVNAMFDATNARLPKEGIRPGCAGYKTISEFLGKLQPTDTFATDVTMASLRVTLQSILDLVDYLCEKIAYEYVLTAKFNQDCLEKFFGLCRSFGGEDCHPTITSFGHVFRLLSIFSPTKRLIKGNTRADEDVSVAAVSYCDALKQLKASQNSLNADFEKDLENKILEKICNNGCRLDSCNGQELQSSDYVAYHLSGYIAFKGKRFTDCDKCLDGLIDASYLPVESVLTTLKDLGGLTYPSFRLHHLLSKNIEPYLSNLHISVISSSTFMHDFLEKLEHINCENLGCSKEHSESLAVKIIVYYVTIRMYFYTKIHNREKLCSALKSKQKIKEGKLQ